tara:strand:- start:324 stop:752 length:429 start_codon:yes stop_codon:yes gene_type:complete
MIETVYIELPLERITYLERPEFMDGTEQSFRDALTASLSKYGFRDPVYCWYNSKNWKDKIKIIVGNNRMVVAKELGIKTIPVIVTNFKADEFPLRGEVMETDEQIKKLFYLPDQLQIRRDKNGNIDQVMPVSYKGNIRNKYV